MEKEIVIRPLSYRIMVAYEFIGGFVELFLGFGVLFLGNSFNAFYQAFALSHLREDPNLFVRTIERTIPFLLNHKAYVIVYFLVFGLSKIMGGIGLWYEKVWAIYMVILLSFLLLPFEVIDFIARPSPFKLIYIIINVLIVAYLVRFQPHIQHVLRKHAHRDHSDENS